MSKRTDQVSLLMTSEFQLLDVILTSDLPPRRMKSLIGFCGPWLSTPDADIDDIDWTDLMTDLVALSRTGKYFFERGPLRTLYKDFRRLFLTPKSCRFTVPYGQLDDAPVLLSRKERARYLDGLDRPNKLRAIVYMGFGRAPKHVQAIDEDGGMIGFSDGVGMTTPLEFQHILAGARPEDIAPDDSQLVCSGYRSFTEIDVIYELCTRQTYDLRRKVDTWTADAIAASMEWRPDMFECGFDRDENSDDDIDTTTGSAVAPDGDALFREQLVSALRHDTVRDELMGTLRVMLRTLNGLEGR